MKHKDVVLIMTGLTLGNTAVSVLYAPRYAVITHLSVAVFVASMLMPLRFWPVALGATLALAGGSYAIFADAHSWSYLGYTRPFAIFIALIVVGMTPWRYRMYRYYRDKAKEPTP